MTESRLGIKRVLIVYAHPARDSLNGAILDAFTAGLDSAGLEHRLRDLCRIPFDPVLGEQEWREGFAGIVPQECQAEQEQLRWADALVWIFPAWNFSLPAILKGYLDRVFMIPGFSFASDPAGMTYQGGLLRHKKALVLQTHGSGLATGFRFGNVADYAQSLVSALHYTGIHNVQVAQFWNLYRETEKDSPGVSRILAAARHFGETFDEDATHGVQIVSSLPTP